MRSCLIFVGIVGLVVFVMVVVIVIGSVVVGGLIVIMDEVERVVWEKMGVVVLELVFFGFRFVISVVVCDIF